MGQPDRGGAGDSARVGAPRSAGDGEGAPAAVRVLGDDGQVYGRRHGQEGPEEARTASLSGTLARLVPGLLRLRHVCASLPCEV